MGRVNSVYSWNETRRNSELGVQGLKVTQESVVEICFLYKIIGLTVPGGSEGAKCFSLGGTLLACLELGCLVSKSILDCGCHPTPCMSGKHRVLLSFAFPQHSWQKEYC